jgi:hypothetical protein
MKKNNSNDRSLRRHEQQIYVFARKILGAGGKKISNRRNLIDDLVMKEMGLDESGGVEMIEKFVAKHLPTPPEMKVGGFIRSGYKMSASMRVAAGRAMLAQPAIISIP